MGIQGNHHMVRVQNYLRRVHGVVKDQDEVIALSKILRAQERSNADYIEFAGEAYEQVTAWKELVNHCGWVNNGNISVNNLASLLHLSTTLKHLPEGLVDSIEEK